MQKINETHLHHLSQLDKILRRVYNDGNNKATFIDIFKGNDKELSETVAVIFVNHN